MSGYRSSEIEIGSCAAKRLAKSSRSRMRATVIVRRQPQDLREVELREPLAVEADLRALGVDDRRRLVEVRFAFASISSSSIGRSAAARRIADPRRVVADDQHACVPLALKGAHPLERDAVAERDVRRRDVDPELHAQRPPERELALQLALRERRETALRVRSSRLTRSSLDSCSCAYDAKPRPAKKNGRRIRKLRLLALVAVLGLLSSASFIFGLVTAIASQLPEYDPAHQQKIAQDGYVYDRHGKLLAVLRGQESRVILPSGQIAPIMKQAIVAIEDKRFYDHRGVDLRAIGRAFWADVQNQSVVEGGSTITQQFIKNAYVKDDRSIARKLKEAALAWQLEQRHKDDKDWILTAYLNTIYFGNGAYGIEQAAITYFHEHASELTLPQAALLAGIPRDPSRYDPVTNPKAALARRRLVLDQMRDQGLIAPDEYRMARSAALPHPDEVHLPGTQERQGQYFVNYVKEQLIHEIRRRPRVRRRAARLHDTRPRPPEAGPRLDREGAQGSRGPAGGARGDRQRLGRGARDGRRLELPREPVQPRRPGRAPAGLGVQALRAGDGACRRSLARNALRFASGRDPARRPALAGEQLRRLLSRLDRPRDGDDPLGQLRLRAADVARRAAGRRPART